MTSVGFASLGAAMRCALTFIAATLLAPAGAYAEDATIFRFSTEAGEFNGSGLDTEEEVDNFVLGDFSVSHTIVHEGDLSTKFNGRLSRNLNTRDGDGTNDQYMSAIMADVHVSKSTASGDFGAFAGLWLGEIDDGEPGDEDNIDRAFQYFVGGEYGTSFDETDVAFQLGWVDTASDDFSNTTDEGYDYRQVRNGIFAIVSATHDVNDVFSLTGRASALHGTMSDSNAAIDDGDYTGVFLEIAGEYVMPDSPFSFLGGLRFAEHSFNDPDDPDQTIRTTSVFFGANYALGKAARGTQAERRRALNSFDSPWFLVNGNTSSVGNLN